MTPRVELERRVLIVSLEFNSSAKACPQQGSVLDEVSNLAFRIRPLSNEDDGWSKSRSCL